MAPVHIVHIMLQRDTVAQETGADKNRPSDRQLYARSLTAWAHHLECADMAEERFFRSNHSLSTVGG